MKNRDLDRKWMSQAIALAQKGIGTTSPNPCVGAVVVRAGRIVGEGFHRKAGEAHAEAVALRAAGRRAKGADLYVTLEPCSTVGKTPACTGAIAEAGIRRVIFGAVDPNPKHFRQASKILRSKGIRVDHEILENECRALNRPFESWILRGRPWVALKMGVSLDGRIATRTGESRWITGPESREKVQELRFAADAILVGANTARRDNPRLDVRGARRKKILKVVVGSSNPLSPKARLFESGDPVLVVTARPVPARTQGLYKGKAEFFDAPDTNGQVDLKRLMLELARRSVQSLLVEGGGETAAAFLGARFVDEVFWFVGPKLIGGRDAVASVGGAGVRHLADAVSLEDVTLQPIGSDVLVHGLARYPNESQGRRGSSSRRKKN